MEPPCKRQKTFHPFCFHQNAADSHKRKREPASLEEKQYERLLSKQIKIQEIPLLTRNGTCGMEKIKNHNESWSGRTEPIDKYDFLIISSMTNNILRYVK